MEALVVHAHKLKVTIPEDHLVELRLPDDFPEGPAEIIVLTAQSKGDAESTEQQRSLAALADLRSVQLTPEEEEMLDQFETFRREHPIRFSSLTKP